MKAWADEPSAFSHNCSSPWQLSVPLGIAEVVNAVGMAGVDVVLRAVLPGILSSLGNQMDDLGFLILHVVSFAITVWAFVELGCLRGTLGPNQYGPDPLSNPT